MEGSQRDHAAQMLLIQLSSKKLFLNYIQFCTAEQYNNLMKENRLQLAIKAAVCLIQLKPSACAIKPRMIDIAAPQSCNSQWRHCAFPHRATKETNVNENELQSPETLKTLSIVPVIFHSDRKRRRLDNVFVSLQEKSFLSVLRQIALIDSRALVVAKSRKDRKKIIFHTQEGRASDLMGLSLSGESTLCEI